MSRHPESNAHPQWLAEELADVAAAAGWDRVEVLSDTGLGRADRATSRPAASGPVMTEDQDLSVRQW